MKYFAVIDTNVLVSDLLRSSSIPGIITQESLDGRIIHFIVTPGEMLEILDDGKEYSI